VTPLTHFSLFSGIGGLDLAAEWAGFRAVGQVEKDDYANKILRKHWPNVPRWGDIKDVTIHSVREAGIEHAPTVLSGGFPCQPFSCAGQRRGAEDDRYLWPEMLRVVQELRPAWVVGENVAGIISMALDDVCSDLERAGYSCRAFLLPAAGVGAPHMRDRVFIVAHSARELSHRSGGARRWWPESADCGSKVPNSECINEDAGRSESGKVFGAGFAPSGLRYSEPDVPDPYGERREERDLAPGSGEAGFPPWRADPFGGFWLSEPPVGRVADGVPSRVDRLRALGNAVVPQQAFPIFQAIAAIEMGAVV
jgi:DNA (cytosine-5)-methyltransferase 1